MPNERPHAIAVRIRKLRFAKPAVVCEAPSQNGDIPSAVLRLKHRLIEKVELGFIPGSLKQRISDDYPTIAEDIKGPAYAAHDRSESESQLESLWEECKGILDAATKCCYEQKDENAWVNRVVMPALKLALRKNKWVEVESVQTQSIDPACLSSLPNTKTVSKKADFTFSFNSDEPSVSSVYERMERKGIENLGHTTDPSTRRLALYSGIEVKPENGGKEEALAQLAIWLVAMMVNLKRLRFGARPSPGRRCSAVETSEGEPQPFCIMPIVGCTIIGHDWHFYIAYERGSPVVTGHDVNEGVEQVLESKYAVVGPWKGLEASTRDAEGLFKILAIIEELGAVARTDYWPWLTEQVLLPLVA